jgi:DNA-binding CsgD family transcriptional regulator/tetratricopeptide (TPR) repeat protein
VATDWPLVGRELELAQMARALDDPTCGGVLLIGPPGVGKTRLATHGLAQAAQRGFVTRAVRATPGASSIPFAALAPLFPDLDLPSEANAPLFQAAAAAIDALGAGRRPVVMVDDAQELDDASAALLDQLVTTADVFAVLTARSTELRESEPARATVIGMWKDEQIIRIDLTPLGDAEMRRLAIGALDGPVDGATVQSLIDASSGNVLFLRELIQGALESGSLINSTGVWRLMGPVSGTPRLRDLIGARLVGLLDEEREALELIALAEPVSLRLLRPVVPLVKIEHLEGRGLIEARSDDEVGLVHPLYGELLRSGLSPLRRERLCRALAEAAEALGELRTSDVLRAAVWRLQGGGDVRPDLAVTASRIAFRSGEYDLAARLARRAWDVARTAEVGLLLGDALDYAGRHEEADEVLAMAGPLAEDDGTRTGVARRRASNLFRALGRPDDADRVVAEAMNEITDPGNRRDLDALRANHLLLSGDVARALELSGPLLERPGDSAFAQASLDAGTALALAGRTTDAITHTEQALAARVDGDEVAQLSALAVYSVARALALCEAGRLDEAASVAQNGYATSIELKVARGQAWFATTLARVFLCQGRLGAASHLFRETTALFAEDGHPGERWGLGGLALAAGQLGDRATADWAIAALDATLPTPVRMMDVELCRGRAWAAVAWGDLSAAGARLWEAVELAERWGQRGTAAAALHDLVRIGNADAGAHLEAIADLVDGELMAGRVAYARAVTSGRVDDAASASVVFERCGAMLFAAEARALESNLAREDGLQRRAAEAQARSTRLLESCEGARTPALSTATVALSSREREVALLAASGLTSRQVAERLFVSVRTVDNHLQRVYMKLGVTNRDALADVLEPAANARVTPRP